MDFHEEVIAVGHAGREWVGALTVRVGASQGGNCVPREGSMPRGWTTGGKSLRYDMIWYDETWNDGTMFDIGNA